MPIDVNVKISLKDLHEFDLYKKVVEELFEGLPLLEGDDENLMKIKIKLALSGKNQ